MNTKRPELIVKKKSPYKDDKTVAISLRISKELLAAYDDLAINANHSRNEVMKLALEFAIEHIRIVDELPSDNQKEAE